MTVFGDRLRTLREEKGLTQEELGKEFGVDKTAVSKWEKGHRIPVNNDAVIKMAEYFDTPIYYLLGVTNERHFSQLSEEEAAALAEAEEKEILDAMINRFQDLSHEMQSFVKMTINNAYKFDESRGKLQSQQEEN